MELSHRIDLWSAGWGGVFDIGSMLVCGVGFFLLVLRAPPRLRERVDPGPDEIPMRLTLSAWSPFAVSRALRDDHPDLPSPIQRCERWMTRGRDVGSVAFVDGWLVFRGERTNWSVRAADVRILGDSFTFLYGLEDRVATLSLLDGWGASATETKRLWVEWRLAAAPPGEAILPPTTAAPERTRVGSSLLHPRVLAMAAGVTFTALFLLVLSHALDGLGWWWLALFTAIFMAAALVPGARRHRRFLTALGLAVETGQDVRGESSGLLPLPAERGRGRGGGDG